MSVSNGSSVNAASTSDNTQAGKISTHLKVDNIVPHKFGDFGGALSWPVPLSVAEQKLARAHISKYVESGIKPGFGILDYLNSDQPLSTESLQDPAAALEALITGARGQALGLVVQTHLNGISTDVSISEYALAAVHWLLDPASMENTLRNQVAGFDLATEKHWGKCASVVFDDLRAHLIAESLISPAMAGLATYALLLRKAAVFLIKDIPDSVKYGTTAWFNLAVAAATIDAQSPGKLANMTFAQVMVSAQSAALLDPVVTRQAHASALVDWGVVNGVLERAADERYSNEKLDYAKTAFNQQLADRLETSTLLNSQIPSRKEIALAKLREKFGDNVPFEERVFELADPLQTIAYSLFLGTGPVSKYSLLDMAMIGGPPYYQWKTDDPRLKPLIGAVNATLEFGVPDTFKTEFGSAVRNLKKVADGSVRHLISQLPLKDRENLEYGKVDFYQQKTYRLSTGFVGKNHLSTSPALILRVERGVEKKLSIYRMDLSRSMIDKTDIDPATAQDEYDLNIPSIQYTTEPFHVAETTAAAQLKQKQSPNELPPQSYRSRRTTAIASAFVEHLDLDSQNILKAAEGITTKDREDAAVEAARDFVLNLIPFKSSITNFVNGNHVDGAVDLFLDLLGFVTAGAGAVTKLAQIGAKTASAIGTLLKAAKIIGAVIIGELNPLSGLDDLAVGGARLLGRGLKFTGAKGLQQINKLRGAASSYDLLQALSKEHGPTLIGTWKLGEQSVESLGVLNNDKWYHYNPVSNRLYGTPGDFRPTPGRFGLNGFDNKELSRLAVKSAKISGLQANAKGIFRSVDGQRCFIRNIDATGKSKVYLIRDDFNVNLDITDVAIVDPATNRVQGTRLRQVAPDQWQSLSVKGGDITGGVDGAHSSAFPRQRPAPAKPVYTPPPFKREGLPNGLEEPAIQVVLLKDVRHLSYDWGKFQFVPYATTPTNIHQALSGAEFARLPIIGDLFNAKHWSNPSKVDPQLTNREGGGAMIFSMQRMTTSGAVKTEFNALKVVEVKAGERPGQLDSVHAYWAPQGGYVDIPVHPGWAEPDHVFTPNFSGCSFTVDQMGEKTLRVRHVEAGMEAAQYNDLPVHEHGWGQSAAMEFPDYGLRMDRNGNADMILTGFSFMKYDRTAGQWTMHYQSHHGGPMIDRFSKNDPGWFDEPTRIVKAFTEAHIVKTGAKPVKTVASATQQSGSHAAIPA